MTRQHLQCFNMKKNYKWKNEKKIFSWFFIILHISQNPILGVKNKFSPFFSAISSPIGLKIFLVILQLICGVYFFWFVDISYQSNLAGFAKFLRCGNVWDNRKKSGCSVIRWSGKECKLNIKKNYLRGPPPLSGVSKKRPNENSWNFQGR